MIIDEETFCMYRTGRFVLDGFRIAPCWGHAEWSRVVYRHGKMDYGVAFPEIRDGVVIWSKSRGA